ncbi:MerR family DNA-binding protein [Kribbella sp. NPDC049174]|uniref:MerR family DNA-binding protein n=1 Tax=Kribbella sp. NPDC049174 TaxID=3364112 RepID=UPI003716C18A
MTDIVATAPGQVAGNARLLDEPPRTPGGYREYPVAAVELLRFVRRAQELGFTLDELEELFHLHDGGPGSCDAASPSRRWCSWC